MKLKYGILILVGISLTGFFVIGFNQGHIFTMLYEEVFDDLYIHEFTQDMRYAEKVPVYVIIPKGAVIEGHIAFIPEEITVVIGINNTITWINEDDAPHSVTPDHREYQFGSLGVIKSGESYTHTFDNVGVFPYHMEPHPWMTGTVKVLDKPTISIDGFSFSDFYGNNLHLFLLIVPIVMFIIIWEYRKRSV